MGQGEAVTLKLSDNKSIKPDVLLTASLIAGIILGVLAGADMEFSGFFGVQLSVQNGWTDAFLSCFIGSASFVTAAFLLGFSAVSHPFLLMLVAFKGLGLGVLVRSVYSGDNIFRDMAAFLPFALLSSGVLILQSCESLGMSGRYFSLSVTNENRLGIANEFRDYIFKFLIYLLSCGLISALNCLLARALESGGKF